MIFKLKDKFVCIKDYSFEEFSMQKNTIFKLGEACYESNYYNKNMLEIYGDDYEITFGEEELEKISEHFVPLAIYRDKRIDEILD